MMAQKVYDLVKEGHSVCITGQAGTGKSYLLRNLYRMLCDDENFSADQVGLTATTGKACQVFYPLPARTVHWYCGIGDGRHRNINERVNTDPAWAEPKKRVQNLKVLIVDEISMLSRAQFEQVSAFKGLRLEYLF